MAKRQTAAEAYEANRRDILAMIENAASGVGRRCPAHRCRASQLGLRRDARLGAKAVPGGADHVDGTVRGQHRGRAGRTPRSKPTLATTGLAVALGPEYRGLFSLWRPCPPSSGTRPWCAETRPAAATYSQVRPTSAYTAVNVSQKAHGHRRGRMEVEIFSRQGQSAQGMNRGFPQEHAILPPAAHGLFPQPRPCKTPPLRRSHCAPLNCKLPDQSRRAANLAVDPICRTQVPTDVPRFDKGCRDARHRRFWRRARRRRQSAGCTRAYRCRKRSSAIPPRPPCTPGCR